jgi:nitric oxide reductase NorQ protein
MLKLAKVFDNGNVFDTDGNLVMDVPSYTIRKALDLGMAIKQIATTAGGTQWRLIEMSAYDELTKHAKPIDKMTSNTITSTDAAAVQKYLDKCATLKPSNLIISDLKWKYLMRSVLRGKNIMMTGPSGCGKTLSAQSVAKALDSRPFFYFNLGATQDPRSTLIGNTHFAKEKGTFVAEALFVKAIQQDDAIILLDELTRAHADAWNILMTVLDENQRYLRIDEMPDTPTIKVGKGVTFIATANIGSEYTATRVLDRAMLDRFASIVEMEPLGLDDEVKLLRYTFPDVNATEIRAIAEIAAHTRQQVKSDDPKVTTMISSRVTVEMVGLLYDGFTMEEAAESSIFPFFSNAGGADSERTYMRQLVQKYIGTGNTDAKLDSAFLKTPLVTF